jgi:excisionase family DNA binding protein
MTLTTRKINAADGGLLVHKPTDQSPQPKPLTISVAQACRLSGLGPTTVWKLLHERKLQAVRPAGYRRTLIAYDSLARLLAPDSEAESPECKKPERPRKPLKYSDPDCAGTSQ